MPAAKSGFRSAFRGEVKKIGNRFSYATNRDEKAWRCVMTSSILLKISSMESASEGAMTSKEHSHLEQYQK
jgi:hypothetical protein